MKRCWNDFRALYGGAKGARAAFEEACEALFRKQYAGQNAQAVRAYPGDEGIDIFVGDIGVEPIKIFQCKFFLEKIEDSQKAQIRKSFKTTIESKEYKITEWTLCIPKTLDLAENKWWCGWKRRMEEKHHVKIDLKNGNELIELMKHVNVYNTFFKIEDSKKIDEIHKAVVRENEKKSNPLDRLARHLKDWFTVLNYHFEEHNKKNKSYFEWIINIPIRRKRYERVLVLGVSEEVELKHVKQLQQKVEKLKCDEGWIVTNRRISQAARDEIKKEVDTGLSCFTFDELLEEDANFTVYFDWLEQEIEEKGIVKQYIPLACKKDEFDPETRKKLGESIYNKNNGWIEGYINRWLDDPSKKHISILGEFGTGKTWFTLHFTWVQMQKYKEAKDKGLKRPRLPVYIPLRDYAKAVSIESLFSEFFFRKHEIPIPGYSAFEQLNKMGKLLLIFDGFDEMADRVDRQKMINNFWELAIAVRQDSKVILTCRNEHFPDAKEGRALLNARLKACTANLTGEPPQFEVLELMKFDNEQIRQLLSIHTNQETIEKIIKNEELMDLAKRPVMIELILEALPEIEVGKRIDLSRIYLYAVSRKMRRDIKEERTFTSLADKFYFMCEVSWEMLSQNKLSLNYRLFPDKLRQLFGEIVSEQKDLDHWHYDMMGQSMLIRNEDGDYKPAHRSLLEFFTAYKLAAGIGVIQDDFLMLVREQSNIDEASAPKTYTWSGYFQRKLDQKGNIIRIHAISEFEMEPMGKLVQSLDIGDREGTVEDFLSRMIDAKKLLLISPRWLSDPNPRFVKFMTSIIRKAILSGQQSTEVQLAYGDILLKVLSIASEKLSHSEIDQGGFWVGTIRNCFQSLDNIPVNSYAQKFRELFLKNNLYWWRNCWLHFLGKKRLDILEQYIVDQMDKMEECLLGKAIWYLGNIKTRSGYDKIRKFITHENSFIRLRSLYYLWCVDPEQFYLELKKLERPVEGKIFISDDKIVNLKLFSHIFKKIGFPCITEPSPLVTLEKLETADDIILLITDLNKPQMSGIEMIRKLRATFKRKYLPIIVCSASTFWRLSGITDPLKIDFVIKKSFEFQEILNIIKFTLLYDSASLEEHFRTSKPEDTIFEYMYENFERPYHP